MRREKSTVATKRSGGVGRVDRPRGAGPGSTTAMRSTRSASSTNRCVGSSTSATVPVDGIVARERGVARRREERTGRGRVAGLLEEQAEVGGGPAPSAVYSDRCRHSGSYADGSSMCARTSAGGHSRSSNLRPVSRSSSWSAVSEKSTGSSPQCSVPRETQHALGDDVALDLRAAAGDRVRERHEEAVHEAVRRRRRARDR